MCVKDNESGKHKINKLIDVEHCKFDDIRFYLNIYCKMFGEEFIRGFDSVSSVKYNALYNIDFDEFLKFHIFINSN
jgi:hypothetical protein